MIKAAVIGHPVSHSLSPLIHEHWFHEHAIEGAYHAVEIDPADLTASINEMKYRGYAGFNVTVPHKHAIMPLCDTLDDVARAIGAVNTVIIRDGKIEGRNTDAFGFIANLKQSVPDFNFKKSPVVVLGAGGAARAVIYGLQQEGVSEIRLTNRTRENAEALVQDFKNIRIVDWDDRASACEGASLLVNTTILGMKGQHDLEMDLSALPKDAVVYDIVYKPLMTELLQHAKKRKLKIVTGIGMLLHQARPAFAAWTGTMPAVTPDLESLVTEKAR